MKFLFLRQHRLDQSRSSLRLLIFLSFLCFIISCVQGQSVDSVIHIDGVVSTEYADIFRKRSDQSSMTIFMREIDAAITASHGYDTLILGYSGWNQYASYNLDSSSIAASADNSLRTFSLQWISSIGWIDYSGTILIPFSHRFFPLYYRAWIRLKPIGTFLNSTVSCERIPTTFSSGIGLKDFSFPLNERSTSSAWNIQLQSRPIECIEGTFLWGKKITTTTGEANGFSSPLDWNTRILSARLTIFFQTQPCAWLGWDWSDGKGKTPLNKDGLKFGSLSYGSEYYYHVFAGGKTDIFSFPLSCTYQYRRWEGEVHGHIESWPFLSFVESVFTNRITYEGYGNIDIHQIETRSSMKWGDWDIEPVLGMLYILPDISLLYREYDFPPIVKKITREQFSVEHCWLLQLGCKVEFPFFHLRVSLQLEQFIPVVVKEREKTIGTGGSSEPSVPAVSSGTPSSTDGGRWIRLKVFFP